MRLVSPRSSFQPRSRSSTTTFKCVSSRLGPRPSPDPDRLLRRLNTSRLASVLVPAQIQIVHHDVKMRLVSPRSSSQPRSRSSTITLKCASSLSRPYLGLDLVPSRSLFLIFSSCQLRRSSAFKGEATIIVQPRLLSRSR